MRQPDAGRWRQRRVLAWNDSGQVTAFAVLMTVALLVLAGLVLDAGLA